MRQARNLVLDFALIVGVMLLALSPATAAPEASVAGGTASRGIELGVSGGLLLVPGTASLPVFGMSAGVSLSDVVALRFAYSHAGIGLAGIELVGINLLDLAIVLETSWRSPFGAYGLAGGSYLLAGALGESYSGALLLGGVGVRLSPADYMSIRLGYAARVRGAVMHILEAGFSVRF